MDDSTFAFYSAVSRSQRRTTARALEDASGRREPGVRRRADPGGDRERSAAPGKSDHCSHRRRQRQSEIYGEQPGDRERVAEDRAPGYSGPGRTHGPGPAGNWV